MSDTSQGDGWWLASDGKWYPPELHRDHVAPAPPSESSLAPPAESSLAPPSEAGPPTNPRTGRPPVYRRPWFLITGGVIAALALIGIIDPGNDDEQDQASLLDVPPTAATIEPPDPTPQPAPTQPPDAETPTATPLASEPPATAVAPTLTPSQPPPLDFTAAIVEQARDDLESLATVGSYDAPVGYVRFDYQGDGWSDLDGNCISTRHEVLAAESLEPVTWSSDGCFVETGLWIDAWSGEELTDASQATIDHVVSLFHAHEAGAWAWDSDTKQRFTNDTHPQALNVVSQSTNSAKDAGGPATWRPAAESAWCAFALDWTATKARWDLATTPAERFSLQEMLDTCTGPTSAGPRTETPIDADELSIEPFVSLATPTPIPPTPTPVPTNVAPSCDPNYSGACIPVYPPDVNCGDISAKRFQVIGRDVHDFDGDGDGVACES